MINNLLCYKTMPVWHRDSLPKPFLEKHNTQAGTWAKLTVLQGHLNFATLNEQGETEQSWQFDCDHQPPFIDPQQWHRIVSVSEDVACQLAFYCQPEDYYAKKFGLTRTHSEVIAAAQTIIPGNVLDVGCGGGRNSLYLNLNGFNVTSWDKNPQSLTQLAQIIADEKLQHITAQQVDLNTQPVSGEYDFILSTVVMMFLDPQRIPSLIREIQSSTRPGGYNLIVSAMTSPDTPCPVDFPFTFQPGELRDYYQGWQLLKYNEDVGELHKTDAAGKRIQLRFATLLARK